MLKSFILAIALLCSGVAYSADVDNKPKTEVRTPPNPDMVWHSAKSKVYHVKGTRWYGATKAGEWLTEEQAKAKGLTKAVSYPVATK